LLRFTLLLISVALVAPARADSSADGHLRAGARYFRDGRFAEALVEFKAAERRGAPGARWYGSAALVKLGRFEEAIEGFASAERSDPAMGDAFLGYYRALALHEARLYLSADRVFAEVGENAGPRISELVREVRGRIAARLEREPAPSSIDWYHRRAADAAAVGRYRLAEALLGEAVALAERRGDGYRRDEAAATLARLSHAGTIR
jgi:tetratricopeptide (TPR) repeat protein